MARTNIPIVALEQDVSVLQATGVAVDPTNDHIINSAFARDHEDIVVDIDSTFAGAKVFEFVRRDGTKLSKSLNAQRALTVLSGEFKQDDGSIWIDVPAAATGTIRVYSLSKKIA